MIIFAAILFFLLVIAIKVSIFVFLSSILLGLGIIVFGNIISKAKRGKFPPVLWNILAVVATICSTAVLWKDILDDSINFGPLPFVILLLFAFASSILLLVSMIIKENNNKSSSPSLRKEKTLKVTPKKISYTKQKVDYENKRRRSKGK